MKLDKMNIKDLKSTMLNGCSVVALLKDAKVWKDAHDELLSDIMLKCQLCETYAKTPPRSVVSMPTAKDFNEKVAIDFKYYKG